MSTSRSTPSGFGVNAKARKQLQCIADAGHGTYYDAKDATALTTSLTKLSQRALRPFTVDGVPVVATEDAAQAPVIKPGPLHRHLRGVRPTAATYRVPRTPGSVVHFSLVARPAGAGRRRHSTRRTWTVKLDDP